MKKLLFLLLLPAIARAEQCQIISPLPIPVTFSGCTYSGTLPSNSTSYIQNTLAPTTTIQSYSVQKATVTDSFFLPYIAAGNCVQTDASGQLISAGAACGTGGGSSLATISSITNNFTIGSTSTVVLADATGGSLTVTMPTAVGITGKIISIKRLNSGANTVTIATSSAQTIDGGATAVLLTQYTSLDLISDGANWSLL